MYYSFIRGGVFEDPQTPPPTPLPDPARPGSGPARPGSGPGPDRVREGVWGAKLGSKKFDLDRYLQDPKVDPKKSRLEPPKKCSKKCSQFLSERPSNSRSGPKDPVTLGSKTAHCDSARFLDTFFRKSTSANSQTWTREGRFKGPVLGCVLDTFLGGR
jgi:hypothetical protein